MFQFLFKYPRSIFSKGDFVLLGPWPKWVLYVLVIAIALLLARLIRARLPQAAAPIRNWHAGIIWLLQFFLATVVLVLLWQPAITVAELKPQQNIIAVLIDILGRRAIGGHVEASLAIGEVERTGTLRDGIP